MASPTITPGRTLILFANLSYALGAYIADYSSTHLFNPRWPPHAKFHNGQTMTLSLFLALTSTYLVFRPTPNAAEARASAIHAAWVGSLYCLAGLCAILYPGTKWMDPEFGETNPQLYMFSTVVGLEWVGALLEWRRLRGLEGKEKVG